MAIFPYSKRFAAVAEVPAETLVHVPGGFRWILRDIEITNLFLATGAVAVLIQNVAYILYVPVSTADGIQHRQWEGRVVLEPGETLQILNSAKCHIVVSGYELSV